MFDWIFKKTYSICEEDDNEIKNNFILFILLNLKNIKMRQFNNIKDNEQIIKKICQKYLDL